jgi:O-antigen ligase
MEIFLLKLVALLRPLASMKYVEEFFVVFGVGLFMILFGAVLVHGAVRKSLKMSAVDGIVVAFAIWCITISLVYYEAVNLGDLAKLLIPILSYTIVKNVIPNRRKYLQLAAWMIAGFSIPTVLSAVLIMVGSPMAVDTVNYWTNITRWQGVYTHSHNLGLSMTLLLITIILYVVMRSMEERERRGAFRLFENAVLLLLGIAAIYCLYMSEVRTALLGFLLFIGIFSYAENKKVFVIGAGVLTIVAIVAAPYWLKAFNPELGALSAGQEVAFLDMGSGRPRIWLNDITVYAKLPIDQKIAGVGIGAGAVINGDEQLYGHSDWLGLLTQTGLVGLALFLFLQIAMFRAILRMHGRERYLFLALFAAVNVMMVVSNGIVWRIQVSHLYFMLLAYIEIPPYRALTESSVMQGATSTAGGNNPQVGI